MRRKPLSSCPPAHSTFNIRWMAAVHIGLLEPAALAVVYLYRAYRARAFANNALANAAMATLSASALLWLVALKPKKKTA